MIAAILALAGVFLLAPGGSRLFDGLPINGASEFISAAVLIVIAVSSPTRATLAASPAALRRTLLLVLTAGLVAKAAVVSRGRYDGLLGCYQGASARVEACAPSYDNPFRLHSVTRIDRSVAFDGDSWRLGVLNKREYDAVRDNSPLVLGVPALDLVGNPQPEHYRPNVPFAARWESAVTAASPTAIDVRYAGEGEIDIDGVVTPLPPQFGEHADPVRAVVPAGTHGLTIRYAWAPALDFNSAVPKKARFSLEPASALRFGTATGIDRALADAADILGVIAFTMLVVGALSWRMSTIAGIALPAAFAALMLMLPVPHWWRDKLIELAMIALCLPWILKKPQSLAFVLLLTGLGLIRVGFAAGPAPGVVHYRGWGEDGLSYETFAREMFETGTLRAGENSFTGQALFRYVRVAERLLMGEAEWLIVVCALVCFYLAYSWLARRALDAAPRHTMLILGTTGLLLWIMGGAISFVDSAMMEYPAWALVPVSTGLLLLGRSAREHLVAAALIGAGVLLRFNHLPAWLIVLTVFALRPTLFPSRGHTVVAVLAIFAFVVCVPMLAHNLYYGHEWRVIPNSAQVNVDLPIANWTLSALSEKMRYLFHIGTDAPTSFFPLHALQLILAAAAVAVFTGRWRLPIWHRLLWLAPLAALAVHLVFVVNVYYPRHILFAYLLGGALVLVMAAEDGVEWGKYNAAVPHPAFSPTTTRV